MVALVVESPCPCVVVVVVVVVGVAGVVVLVLGCLVNLFSFIGLLGLKRNSWLSEGGAVVVMVVVMVLEDVWGVAVVEGVAGLEVLTLALDWSWFL